jgi:hypothetical protein
VILYFYPIPTFSSTPFLAPPLLFPFDSFDHARPFSTTFIHAECSTCPRPACLSPTPIILLHPCPCLPVHPRCECHLRETLPSPHNHVLIPPTLIATLLFSFVRRSRRHSFHQVFDRATLPPCGYIHLTSTVLTDFTLGSCPAGKPTLCTVNNNNNNR